MTIEMTMTIMMTMIVMMTTMMTEVKMMTKTMETRRIGMMRVKKMTIGVIHRDKFSQMIKLF